MCFESRDNQENARSLRFYTSCRSLGMTTLGEIAICSTFNLPLSAGPAINPSAKVIAMKNAFKRFAYVISVLLLAMPSSSLIAQNNQTPSPAASPQANPNDVDSLDHIMAAVYDCISGPAGPRNWDRFRSLFYPGARLIPSRRDQAGKVSANSLTADEYAERAKNFFDKEGFFEAAVVNHTEVWDHIAHVWSTYESRHAKGEKPFARGINSFQLLFDGARWWVVTIYWEGEEAAHPIPEKYLK